MWIPARVARDDTADADIEIIVEAVAAIYTPMLAQRLANIFIGLCISLRPAFSTLTKMQSLTRLRAQVTADRVRTILEAPTAGDRGGVFLVCRLVISFSFASLAVSPAVCADVQGAGLAI